MKHFNEIKKILFFIREKTKQNIVYKFLIFSNNLINIIFQNKKLLFIFFILSILFFYTIKFFLSNYFKKIFFILFFTFLGVISLLPQKFKFMSFIGFEFCMMAVVLTTLAYGRKFGIFVAFTTLIGGYILSGNFKPSSFISIFTLPLISLIIPFFNLPLFFLGLLLTFIYDIIILPLYILMGSSLYKSFIFFITHLLFNAWVFYYLAPFFYNIL